MAQTITLRAHGATFPNDARLSSPLSLRASRYFISPAWPAAIQAGKCSRSPASVAGAIPDRSNPARSAASLMIAFTSLMEFVTDFVLAFRLEAHPPPLSSRAKRGTLVSADVSQNL